MTLMKLEALFCRLQAEDVLIPTVAQNQFDRQDLCSSQRGVQGGSQTGQSRKHQTGLMKCSATIHTQVKIAYGHFKKVCEIAAENFQILLLNS